MGKPFSGCRNLYSDDMAKPLFSFFRLPETGGTAGSSCGIGACSLVQYQPTQTISSVRTDEDTARSASLTAAAKTAHWLSWYFRAADARCALVTAC